MLISEKPEKLAHQGPQADMANIVGAKSGQSMRWSMCLLVYSLPYSPLHLQN